MVYPSAEFSLRGLEVEEKLCILKSGEMGFIQEAKENQMKKKVEEALRSKMKQKALKECGEYASKYAQCAAGKTISVVWHCRQQAKELNDCLHQFTNDTIFEEMKKEYMTQKEVKGPVPL